VIGSQRSDTLDNHAKNAKAKIETAKSLRALHLSLRPLREILKVKSEQKFQGLCVLCVFLCELCVKLKSEE